MAVAEIISVLKTIKLGYDIIKCIDKILKERLQESSNRVISHNTNVINEIIRKREYFSAKDNDLYMKKAMIRPLALIGAKMGVLCDNTVSLHSELLSKLNYKNTIEEYIENSTILYNRFKDIILFDPDFPILMGYKSVTEDLPFPEKNHDVRLTGNKEGNKKKLDIAEIEGCIKWSLKKSISESTPRRNGRGMEKYM